MGNKVKAELFKEALVELHGICEKLVLIPFCSSSLLGYNKDVEHQVELATGVLIAATALMGISGLFLAQVRFFLKGHLTDLQRKMLRTFLSISIIAGIFVVFTTFFWFMAPNDLTLYVVWILFSFQAFIFLVTAIRTGFFF